MPEAPIGWALVLMTGLLAAIAIIRSWSDSRAKQADMATERDRVVTQMAANTAKSVSDAADARVAAERASGEARLALSEIGHLKEGRDRLEAANLRLEERLAQQAVMIDGFPDLIAALRREIAALKNPDASATQVAAAEQATAAATAATLTPATADAGTTKIEGVVTLSPTDKPTDKDKPT